jgi:hypothetical protein
VCNNNNKIYPCGEKEDALCACMYVCVEMEKHIYIYTHAGVDNIIYPFILSALFQLGSGQVLHEEPVFPLLILPIYQRR